MYFQEVRSLTAASRHPLPEGDGPLTRFTEIRLSVRPMKLQNAVLAFERTPDGVDKIISPGRA